MNRWLIAYVIPAFAVVMSGARPSPAAATTAPANPGPGVQAVADSANQFALDLYAKIKTTDGNVFFSPYSIDTALAMTYAGARGDTATEMSRALHIPADLQGTQFNDAIAGLIARFQADRKDKGYELRVANALWGMKGMPWRMEFLDLLKSSYGAGLTPLDFADEPAARKIINDWVSDKTSGKIPDLIPKGLLNSGTRMVLTNAIYFKGDWKLPFGSTADAPFHIDGAAATTPVPTMQQSGEFPYMENADLKAINLLYAGDELGMLILLPKTNDGIGALEGKLDQKSIDDLLNKMQMTMLPVSLPKFKLECQYDLAAQLQALGMSRAFTAAADFSGMDGSRDISISDVIHKAFVEVDEKGTTAAAATGVIGLMSVRVNGAEPFRADHPFIFLIRDMKTGTILFMGHVTNPAK